MTINQFSNSMDLKGNSFIKTATLLTIGFFLVSAPAPDASIIAEMTSNLIVNLPSQLLNLKNS